MSTYTSFALNFTANHINHRVSDEWFDVREKICVKVYFLIYMEK